MSIHFRILLRIRVEVGDALDVEKENADRVTYPSETLVHIRPGAQLYKTEWCCYCISMV